jgi:2'-5' RNA ligase
MLRSFIAIELPAEIQEAIARSTASLQKALPKPLVRWVVSRNIHLTLKFLGDVSPANLEQLAGALKVEVAKHETFDLSVGGIGAFPNNRQARVIWIGLDAQPGAGTLQHCVEGVSTRLGYPAEDRPFSPHLTIGRVSQTVSGVELKRIREALETCTIGALGTTRVDAVHIFKSDLRPSGSVYTPMYQLPLRT